ncbi:hypothetical protein M9458_029325, partial [Cirrhinus mrigala]
MGYLMHAHSGQSPLRSTQPKVAAPYENGKALQHCWFPRAGLATRAGRYVPPRYGRSWDNAQQLPTPPGQPGGALAQACNTLQSVNSGLTRQGTRLRGQE